MSHGVDSLCGPTPTVAYGVGGGTAHSDSESRTHFLRAPRRPRTRPVGPRAAALRTRVASAGLLIPDHDAVVGAVIRAPDGEPAVLEHQLHEPAEPLLVPRRVVHDLVDASRRAVVLAPEPRDRPPDAVLEVVRVHRPSRRAGASLGRCRVLLVLGLRGVRGLRGVEPLAPRLDSVGYAPLVRGGREGRD